MEKYRLVNAYGNRVVYTNSEKEKDQLLKRGFYIQEAQPKVTAAPTAKKRKAVKKNEGKAEDKDRS